MSKIMYKDKPYMSTTDLPEMTLTEARTGTEEEPRVISPKTLFEFAVNRLTGNIDIDTSAASGDDYDLTQALTSLGWLTDVVTSGVLGMKKLLHKMLQRLGADLDLRTAEVTYSGTFTIPSSCCINIATGSEPFRGHRVVAMNPVSWGSNTGAFTISSNSGNEVYLIGANGVKVTNLVIRFTYIA